MTDRTLRFPILSVLLALLAGCTSVDTYSLAEQCGHRPGCVTSRPQPRSPDAPLHVDAIRAPDAGRWEPVVPPPRPPKR
jgi:hypothetical protein